MTRADRANLERLARKRAKLAKAQVGERVKVLKADVEDQLAAQYSIDDEVWADLTRHAQAEVAEADARVAEVCKAVGIVGRFRPRLSLAWSTRGESALASRRAELRKLAAARVDAAAETAKVAIEQSLLEVETKLIHAGLETAEALRFVEAMPTSDELLPPVAVAELEPGSTGGGFRRDERRGQHGGWTPPQDAAGALLTPSTAASRAEKRQAVAAALAADPDRSDRAIAQRVGVDHKTVGKLRSEGGEVPSVGGEIPTGIPTGDGVGGAP